jgi:pre-mRNA-splicing factor CDC5/CEF1
MRQDMRSKLAALPKPKETEWEFELPEERTEAQSVEVSEEDAAERDRRNRERKEAAERAEFARQSQVVQRFLPRPSLVDLDAMLNRALNISDPVQREVETEMAYMMANDLAKFGGGRVIGTVKPLEPLSAEALDKAKMELALELSNHTGKQKKAYHSDFDDAWAQIHSKSKLPGLDGYEEDEVDEHQLMVERFDNVRDQIVDSAQKANKLEKKLTLHFGGYQKRSNLLQQKMLEAFSAIEKTRMALDAARTMQASEESAIARRLEKLRDEVAFVSRREREAQDSYRARKEELDSLRVPVNGAE